MKATDILPDNMNQIVRDGVVIRKGTVGAFIQNAKLWADPASNAELKAVAERDMREALPAMSAMGLFEIFELKDVRLRMLLERDAGE